MPNKADRNDARAPADHAHRLVSRGARQNSGLPILARAANGALDGAQQARDVENGIRALLRGVGLKVERSARQAAKTSRRACAD